VLPVGAVLTAGLTEGSTLFDSIEHGSVSEPLGRVPVVRPKISARQLFRALAELVLNAHGKADRARERSNERPGVWGTTPHSFLLYRLKTGAKHELVDSIGRRHN
jgi:hypothetical protein